MQSVGFSNETNPEKMSTELNKLTHATDATNMHNMSLLDKPVSKAQSDAKVPSEGEGEGEGEGESDPNHSIRLGNRCRRRRKNTAVNETKSTQTKSAQTKSAQTKSAQTKSAQTKSVQTKSARLLKNELFTSLINSKNKNVFRIYLVFLLDFNRIFNTRFINTRFIFAHRKIKKRTNTTINRNINYLINI